MDTPYRELNKGNKLRFSTQGDILDGQILSNYRYLPFSVLNVGNPGLCPNIFSNGWSFTTSRDIFKEHAYKELSESTIPLNHVQANTL